MANNNQPAGYAGIVVGFIEFGNYSVKLLNGGVVIARSSDGSSSMRYGMDCTVIKVGNGWVMV